MLCLANSSSSSSSSSISSMHLTAKPRCLLFILLHFPFEAKMKTAVQTLINERPTGAPREIMLLNRPTGTVPLATAAPPSLQPSPAVTHVLCCPGCSFMSLLPSLLASHAYRQHGMASVTIYRCLLCSAASTQSDIMREHAAMYHGLSGDCNIFGQLTTEVVVAPETIERMRGSGSTGGASSLLVGSKKRKSTVPERVSSQTFSIEEVLDSELTSQIQKPKKLRTAATADREPGSKRPSESRHLCKAQRQIQLPCEFAVGKLGEGDCLQKPQQLLGGDFQSDLALDLSLKGGVNKLTSSQPARRSHELPQKPPQQQQQQSTVGRHRQQMSLQTPALSPEPAAAEISTQSSQQQQQRQNFTNSQNSHLAQWFAEHRARPYPSTGETKSLALATGLSYSQVKKWFANKRMRSKSSATLVGARRTSGGIGGAGDPHDNSNEEAEEEEDATLSNGCYPIARVEFSPAGSSLASPDFDERRLEAIPMLV